jgi:AraC-like DNA-binding protein
LNASTPIHVVGGYREFVPPADAADCCEAIWIHRTPRTGVDRGSTHRVLPDMGVSLAFQGFRRDDGAPFDTVPILIGPKLRAQIFPLLPGRELAAVRIKAEWFAPLFDLDPMAFENQVVDLAGVAPLLSERLGDALARTRTAEAPAAVLVAEVRRARQRAHAPSAPAAAALDLVRRTAGRLPCERVADRLGVSDRHLRRQVRDAIGVAPKAYARALRFVEAMKLTDGVERPAWADVALRHGYCDQSHLIRDAVSMTGVAPSALHAERRQELQAERPANEHRE